MPFPHDLRRWTLEYFAITPTTRRLKFRVTRPLRLRQKLNDGRL
jgi:hypothetical protein